MSHQPTTFPNHPNGFAQQLNGLIYGVFKRAVEIVREVRRIGVDVLTISQPYPQPFDERGVLDYVCALSREFGGDVMLYNESAVGNPLSPSMVIKILDKCPNIKYLKDSPHDMIGLHNIVGIPRVEGYGR